MGLPDPAPILLRALPAKGQRGMNILVVSDMVDPRLDSLEVARRFSSASLLLSCGDLPYAYLEYIVSMLNCPMFFVRGNHDPRTAGPPAYQLLAPQGGQDLHRRVVNHNGLLLAGVEGSLRYREGDFQYTQEEMWLHVYGLLPYLLYNKARYGRYLDIFISHAPPQGIHDLPDPAHQGLWAFRWLVERFQPALFFHGHVHKYQHSAPCETTLGRCRVINVYGYTCVNWDEPPVRSRTRD